MDECQHDKCHMGFEVLGRSLRDGGNIRYNEQTQNAAINQLQPIAYCIPYIVHAVIHF